MKSVRQLLKEYVIRAIADDYMEIDRVVADVARWGATSCTPVDREAVLTALEDAIGEGYAQAYVLSGRPPYSTPVEYSPARLEDLWFYVTPKGIQLADKLSEEWSESAGY